jgi:cell wall-associated NlpC family hydrolase
MNLHNKPNQAASYALSLLGLPYKWGGQNPLQGFDCSGLVQEILASVGTDPKGDQTAQALLNYFSRHGHISEPRTGALSFYGLSISGIRHVGFCLNEYQMIEAAGGDSKTLTMKDAIKDDAYVRIRPIMYRSDFIHCLYPNY